MTTKNVYDFLNDFSVEELKDLRILHIGAGRKYILKGESVDPLLNLMKEHSISRLESPVHKWFLDDNREFSNVNSKRRKLGNIAGLDRPGRVFDDMNRLINPYYDKIETEHEAEPGEVESRKSRLERDIQNEPRRNTYRKIGNALRDLTGCQVAVKREIRSRLTKTQNRAKTGTL